MPGLFSVPVSVVLVVGLDWRLILNKIAILLVASVAWASTQCVASCRQPDDVVKTAPPADHCHHSSSQEQGAPDQKHQDSGANCSYQVFVVEPTATHLEQLPLPVVAMLPVGFQAVPVVRTEFSAWTADFSPPGHSVFPQTTVLRI